MVSRRRLAIGVAAAVASLAVAQQLALPPLAEQRLRSQLERDGRVRSVTVSAFPAVKLLWNRADRVSVHLGDARTGSTRLADLLARARRAGRVDARVDALTVLTLRLHDLRVRKRGRELNGEASVADADLSAALPAGFDVRPIASGGGQLVFEGSASLLGQVVRARAVVAAREGRLVVVPDVPLGALATLTVFSDPRVLVQDVGARTASGGFVLTARATLTG